MSRFLRGGVKKMLSASARHGRTIFRSGLLPPSAAAAIFPVGSAAPFSYVAAHTFFANFSSFFFLISQLFLSFSTLSFLASLTSIVFVFYIFLSVFFLFNEIIRSLNEILLFPSREKRPTTHGF